MIEIEWTHGVAPNKKREFVVAEPGLLEFMAWFTESGWVMTKLEPKEWVSPDDGERY